MRRGTVTSFFDLPTVAQQGECVKADHPLGDAIETFIRREEAERCIEEVCGDDLALASHLPIEERELEAGGLT
jgi:hypothetical protein